MFDKDSEYMLPDKGLDFLVKKGSLKSLAQCLTPNQIFLLMVLASEGSMSGRFEGFDKDDPEVFDKLAKHLGFKPKPFLRDLKRLISSGSVAQLEYKNDDLYLLPNPHIFGSNKYPYKGKVLNAFV